MLTPQTVGILTSLPTPLALSLSVYILTLGFTSRNSLLRPLGLIPMISCALLAMHTVRAADKSINPLYTSIFSGGCTGMVLQYLDSVMLSRWTYEAQGPTSALGGQKLLRASKVPIEPKKDRHPNAFFSRLRFGWDEAFRCRSPRSPWEVKHVPRFFPDRPDREPSKTEFLYMMTKEFFVSVLFLDILSLMGRDVSGNPAKFASSEIPLFTRLPSLSAEVVILRLVSSVMHWVVTAFLLQVMYDAAAIAVVLFDFGRVERWPPLFNSWVECWSIRQFWG
ncbi:MAG: hypothetical protein HETSPECPRED_009728 [Heterodermia speciosa]|uniref:Wax synthase domain-containing protein n=1 Tax=Heterodermia speciosa TaxID=116794 RepID=A0A8H3IYY9_9LECA|nr:MAG: hypothetical protein HETSPECPRED_009728 [Heterodermia speciosa]